MDVTGPNPINRLDGVKPKPAGTYGPDKAEKASADSVQISADAIKRAEVHELKERIAQIPDIRLDKVRELRELIDQGLYETEERIDGTVARLLEVLELDHEE